MHLARAGGALVVALLVGAAVAHAASVALTPDAIGAGAVAVDPCTTAGLGVQSNLSGANIVSVTVSGIPASCGTATLLVTVNNGSATGSGSASVPTGGGVVTVSLGAATAAATRVETDLVLVGP